MATYFGRCDSSGVLLGGEPSGYENFGGYTAGNSNAVVPFTCPGSGNQDVVALGHYCYGSSASIRCAVYSTDGNTRYAQGNAGVTPAASAAWAVHSGITQDSPLTGGNNYMLVVSSSGIISNGYATVASNGCKYASGDYVAGGFPATLSLSSGYTHLPIVRCGVDAAAGGGLSIPVAMANYRERRN